MKKNAYSLILYRDKATPQYFQIPRSYVRGFFIGLPIITIFAVLISITGGVYFKHLQLMVEKKEPLIIQTLRNERSTLSEKVKEQETLIKSLTEKMSSPTAKSLHLNLFSPPVGMQDKTGEPGLSVENLEFSKKAKQINIKFNIVNMTPGGKRLSGHIFIVLHSGALLHIFPQGSFSKSGPFLKYNQGESFATSRFRPVNVTFKSLALQSKNYLFKIIIFSRSGDLLFSKIITPNF